MALRARSPRTIILTDNHVDPKIPPRVEYSLTLRVQGLRLMIKPGGIDFISIILPNRAKQSGGQAS